MNPVHEILNRIKGLIEQKKGIHILHTSEIERADREILIHTRWLEEIISGWYLIVRPDAPMGETTNWYANFWDFIKLYLDFHYGKNYCLSAENSLNLHLGGFLIPKQVVVIAQGGSGKPLKLPYNTSLYVYSDPSRLPKEKEAVNGIQVMPLTYALCKISSSYFKQNQKEIEIALQSITDPSDFLRTIVQYNFKTAAARIIGAYQFLGNFQMANAIKNGLGEIGILVRVINPFEHHEPLLEQKKYKSPYVNRILAMWKEYRSVIIDHFPPSKKIKNPETYLKNISELYTQDAYNSLSIEGYQVTPELIEKVKNDKWNPDKNFEDSQQRNALAARGYYESFIEVKNSIKKILNGGDPGKIVEYDLPIWFQKLFGPSVQLGIIPAVDLFGFRRHQVYIRNSRHTPPSKDYLGELMEVFFHCLKEEPHPGVRAILGHFIFVYIHPYMDGNGRIGRFLMNTMLSSGGYSWTIIPLNKRDQYFKSLEKASAEGNILPFTQFAITEMHI